MNISTQPQSHDNVLKGEALIQAESLDQEARELAETKWGWVSPPVEVIDAAKETLRISRMRSGEYMVDLGIFTKEQIESHLADKPRDAKTLEYLESIDPRVASHIDRYKAAQSLFPYYNISHLRVHYVEDPEILLELDSFDAVPAYLDHDDQMILLFAGYDSLNRFRSLGRDFRLKKSSLYKKLFNDYKLPEPKLALSQSLAVTQILREMQKNEVGEFSKGTQSNHWSVSNSSSVLREERELARLIDYCMSNDINDISLIPESSGNYRIMVRQFGDMVSPEGFAYIDPSIADKMKRFLLSQSGANPTQASRILNPRDGSISYSSAAGTTFIRCSFIPTNHRGDVSNSTSVSLRLLPQGSKKITLTDLNLNKQIINDAKSALSFSSGLILIVGPTNSGKSTTIAGAMNEHISIFGNRRKRLSLEDPIERFLNGVVQFEPSGESDDRFDQMLRAFKRHDPDVVWVGEVRDQQTAELCVDTSASGHLVMTTLHANDTVTGVDLLGRLVPGTKTFQLIESISLVVSQRLVKTICPHCSKESEPSEEEIRVFASYLDRVGEKSAIPESVRHGNPVGCRHCRDGYDGMVPINESLPMTRLARNEALEMVLSQRSNHQALAEHRTLTMLDSAMGLVRAGKVELLSILS